MYTRCRSWYRAIVCYDRVWRSCLSRTQVLSPVSSVYHDVGMVRFRYLSQVHLQPEAHIQLPSWKLRLGWTEGNALRAGLPSEGGKDSNNEG